MKVAINGSDDINSFSHKWIEYCNAKGIEYVVVDCLKTDIINKLKEAQVTHLLWHFGQIWEDLLTARNILFSAEMVGIKVFPNFNTCWHFDDKISQKYLLEAQGIELVKTYIFYSKSECKKWITERENLPVVAKLRRGSGSTSVILLKTKRQLERYANRMFSAGLSPVPRISHDLHKRIGYITSIKETFNIIPKITGRFLNLLNVKRILPVEFGYVYFQDFIPNNSFDTRVVVIGNRAFGIKRLVRKNDFRASGSGHIVYDHQQIDLNCIRIGLSAAKKLKTQCIAVDFLMNKSNIPFITEISYGFLPRPYDRCEGYWDERLNFYPGSYCLEDFIIEDLLS